MIFVWCIGISAFAADVTDGQRWNVYGKTGWFSWKETIDGKPLISDDGPMVAIGATRNDRVYKALSIRETVEVWGGNVRYDGHDIFNSVPIKGNSTYLGTREEVRADVGIPVTTTITVNPFVGIEHKFWVRSKEGEIWNTFTVPIGATVVMRLSALQLFVEGGMKAPIATWNSQTLANYGFDDIIVRPKAQIGSFIGAGLRNTSWDVSLIYEEMRFSPSDLVPGRKKSGNSGLVSVYTGTFFFQPESKTSTLWLKIGYNF